MDLRGLGRALEIKSYHPRDMDERIPALYLENAVRLRRIGKAVNENQPPFTKHPINIADLPDSPLGAGRLSAVAFEYKTPDVMTSKTNNFCVKFFFTPTIPKHSWDDQSYPETISDEKFRFNSYYQVIEPQLDSMASTVEMLEEAIMTDGLDNDIVRARYEAAE